MLEHSRGNVFSIEAVKNELKDPDMSQWAKTNEAFFEPDDLSRFGEVTRWVMSQSRFKQSQQVHFLESADPRVIAFALGKKHTVVTHEAPAPESTRIKIPDVCRALGVDYQNTFEVLNQLHARFILESQVRA